MLSVLCKLTSKLCSLRYVLNIIAFGTCLSRWPIGYSERERKDRDGLTWIGGRSKNGELTKE
jgi:hypothetical protein